MRLLALKTVLFLNLMACLINSCHAMCEVVARQFEQRHGIPDKLLMAISLVESGRKMPGHGMVAWPWTINANGKSYMFPTKAEAMAKVLQLQSQGIQSIDVGCMQINLKHHPNAFRNLSEAFDPYSNISYAARFLKKKMTDHGCWHTAVAHYHSAVPHISAPYKNRVLTTWAKIQKSYVNPQAKLTATLFNKQEKHCGQFETHVDCAEGRKMPVMVQFAPYGLNRGSQPQPISQEKEIIHPQQQAGGIKGGFFQINATGSGRSAKSASLMQVAQQRGVIGKAAFKMKQLPLQKLPIPLSSSGRRGFFPIK